MLWLGLLSTCFAISSLKFGEPYLSHDFHNQNYDFGGSSVLSKSGLELTGDFPGQRGYIISREAALPDDFEVEISFYLSGAARTLYGDGLAIWLLHDNNLKEGEVFGVQDRLRGTALVVDTYRNNRPGKAFPYLVLSQNDGTRSYDIDHDGLANELASASLRGIYNNNQNPSRMRIRVHRGGNIAVSLNYRNDKWETFIDQPFNVDGARYLALSASTGQLSSSHVVTGIEVRQLPPLSVQSEPQTKVLSGQNKTESRFWYTLFKLCMMAVGVAGAVKIVLHYKAQHKRGQSYLP